jgi:hypothetical protein
MLFTTCVERHPTLLSRYVDRSTQTDVRKGQRLMNSLSTMVSHSRVRRRAKFTSELSVDSRSTTVKVVRLTDVPPLPIERVTLFFTLFTDNLYDTTPTSSSSTLPSTF